MPTIWQSVKITAFSICPKSPYCRILLNLGILECSDLQRRQLERELFHLGELANVTGNTKVLSSPLIYVYKSAVKDAPMIWENISYKFRLNCNYNVLGKHFH